MTFQSHGVQMLITVARVLQESQGYEFDEVRALARSRECIEGGQAYRHGARRGEARGKGYQADHPRPRAQRQSLRE